MFPLTSSTLKGMQMRYSFINIVLPISMQSLTWQDHDNKQFIEQVRAASSMLQTSQSPPWFIPVVLLRDFVRCVRFNRLSHLQPFEEADCIGIQRQETLVSANPAWQVGTSPYGRPSLSSCKESIERGCLKIEQHWLDLISLSWLSDGFCTTWSKQCGVLPCLLREIHYLFKGGLFVSCCSVFPLDVTTFCLTLVLPASKTQPRAICWRTRHWTDVGPTDGPSVVFSRADRLCNWLELLFYSYLCLQCLYVSSVNCAL